jgi:ABC-type lipoprotein release transport system permease subunit
LLRQTWQAVRFVRRMVLDPLTYLAVVTVWFVVVRLATWLPSRGAAQVDPVMALRAE